LTFKKEKRNSRNLWQLTTQSGKAGIYKSVQQKRKIRKKIRRNFIIKSAIQLEFARSLKKSKIEFGS